VEHVDETLPGAHTPNLRMHWPRPRDADPGPPPPPKPRAVDEEDARRVRERVHADLLVFPPDLQVRVRSGVLVLEGRASTPQEQKRIEALAREVVGNAVIENRMIVGAGGLT
jgi:osmotically-inducible protein OsmY